MALKRIRLTVELDTGDVHDIVIGNPSLVAWDRTRAKRDWPTVAEAAFVWMTFIAWHHMKATGLVTCDYEEFESTRCVAVGDTDEAEGKEATDVDPTSPTAGAA